MVNLGHARQRCVLAVLLVQANHPVPIDQLVEQVWAQRAPRRARETLYSYLHHLRSALAVAADVRIVRQPGGYQLCVDPMAVDLHRFAELISQARAADDDAAALALWEQALGLWQGTAFAGMDSPWINSVRDGLDKQRLAAQLDYTEVRLRQGQHTYLVAELSARAAEHPLDERLAGQYMLALYRSGRQADALSHYAQIRRRLVDELGSDPSLPLRQLHEAMLRGEVEQPPARTATIAGTTATVAGRNDLPGDLPDFTGREPELCQLLAAIPDVVDASPTAVVIEAIDGMAGVGKTALAVHAAHLLAERYPDAQLFVDLHGHAADRTVTDPMAALDTLLRALGVDGNRIPADFAQRSAFWRAELAGRRVLVVLDDAADAAQVRPLLPGSAQCLTLITSRRRLLNVETAQVLSLDVLPHRDAIGLFTRIVGADRAGAEPGEADAVEEIIQLCGHLPLAIRLAAARLRSRPAWTVRYLAQRLAQGHGRLAELAMGDRSVTAAFELSYQQLTPEQQRLFRLLGLITGSDFDSHAAAALTGNGLHQTDQLLEDLVDVHLLQQPAPGRYRFHDLLHHHAQAVAAQTETVTERDQALHRLFDYYLHTATAAAEHLGPRTNGVRLRHAPAHVPAFSDSASALTWLDIEHPNLVAMIQHTAEHARRVPDWYAHTWQLPRALWRFYFIRGHLRDWTATHQHALAAARKLADPHAEAEILKSLGNAWWQARQFLEALEHYQQALVRYRETHDRKGEAAVLGNMGLIYDALGRYPEAVDHHTQDLALCREIGDRRGEGIARSNLGLASTRLGRYANALNHCHHALTLLRQLGDRLGEGHTLIHIGIIHHRTGNHTQALRYQHDALTLMRELGDRQREGEALANLGVVYTHLGQHTQALEHLQRAMQIADEYDDNSEQSNVLNDLGEANHAAGLLDQALASHRKALAIALDIPDRYQQARAHNGIGHAVLPTDPDTARTHWEQALVLYTELGVPEADHVRARLNQH
jgi:DNA-binding SARP family transcriptional activator/tetratricopeptide (TPR) repeat protein